MSFLREVESFYQRYENEIKAKMETFSTRDPKVIFCRGAYCLLTPQTRAENAKSKCEKLFAKDFFFRGYKKKDFFFHASLEEIAGCLRQAPNVRFHNKKAERLLFWREYGHQIIETLLKIPYEIDQRDFLVSHVKGMGLKESSHFLRNIGMGKNLAILDRHILRFMEEYGLLAGHSNTTPTSKYLYEDWEEIFVAFARERGWSAQEADFSIWAVTKKRGNINLSYEEILTLE